MKLAKMITLNILGGGGAATFFVATNVEVIDGRVSPYDALQPGDTIALLSGTRHPLTIKNIAGTAANPIKITNSGGLVEFTATDHTNTIFIQNCQHFRLTGTGDGEITYGIKITDFLTIGICATCKSDNFEIDHIEMFERHCTAPSYGIGIHVLTYGLPDEYANSYQWDAYDYDGDTVLEGVDGRTYTVENVKIHHCHFDGTEGVRNFDMGLYLGHSNYTENPENRSLYDAQHNLDVVPCYFPPMANIEVYNCLFEHTNTKSVKMGGVTGGALIHDNVMLDTNAQLDAHTPAIDLNPGCTDIEIYNNKMIDLNNGLGLYSYGETVKVYNNLVVNPGYYGMILGALKPAGYHHYDSAWILNNTIVSTSAAHCIGFAASEGSDDRVQNNILINSNGMYVDATLDVYGNNYTNATVGNAKFTDAANDDYTLAADSPCLNAGANLAAYGVTDDLLGTARPQGAAYDQGAYEKQAASLNC